MKNRTGAWLGTALAFVLAACGGGGAGSGSTDRTPSAPPTAPVTTTLADYLKSRAERVTVMGYPEPSAAERAWLFDDSRERAVALVRQVLDNPRYANALALPPLQASFVQTVGAAARGDTLAELRQAYPGAAPGFYASMRRTAGVERSLSTLTGTRFLPDFLTATDSFGPLPPLARWSASEVAEPRDLSRYGSDVRLVVNDSFSDRLDLPRAEAFDGVFGWPGGSRSLAAMVKVASGVTQHQGSDFVAQAMKVDERLLVKIEPASSDLPAFSRTRLSAALSQVVQSATAQTLVALPAGVMVLPRQGFELTALELTPERLPRAFDELRADLRGLDGGGTYLKADARPNFLSIGTTDLSVSGSHRLTFIHSIRNPYSPITTDGVFTQVDLWPPDCGDRKPDLRAFFLALLDADRRVVALAAVSTVEGKLCP
jgi:hypothetical protein